MKQYGLRKIYKDGKHYDFQWPLEVGAIAIAPVWNPEAECGGGLHVLPNAQGNYDLLDGDYWAVVEYDADSLVMIDEAKGKVPSCKIVYLSESPDGLFEYFKDVQFRNISAYLWARDIGDREYMKQFVTDPEWAYCWAMGIGDREYMKQYTVGTIWDFEL